MRASNLPLARALDDRWLIVSVLFMAAGLFIGTANYAFFLFIEPLEERFGWDRTMVTASLSFMAVGSLTGPLLGRTMDRYGARPLMFVSLTIFGVSFLLRPLITQLWHWYALSFLQFVAFSGASILPAGRLVPLWFPKTRGRMMGITTMGNNFGGLTLPLVLAFVISAASWQAGFLAVAAIAFTIAALALVIIHERAPTELTIGADDPAGPSHTALQHGWSVAEAMRTKAFYAMVLTLTLASFTYSGILPHVGAQLDAHGMSEPRLVSLAVALLAAFGMMGKVTFGYMADRITARYAMMISLGGQMTFALLIAAFPTQPAVWVTVPLFGLFMGAHGALANLIIQENFGLRSFGSISGIANVPTVVPMAIGPIIAGRAFDSYGSYSPAFVTVAVLFAVGIASLTQLRRAPPPSLATT